MVVEKPPGVTRFTIQLMPKDGSKHYTLQCDIDEVLMPAKGDTLGLDVDYGLTTTVHSVAVYPTCDPMVYVRGYSLYPYTSGEAERIVALARDHGWRVIG
jgi:hypothetical protein